MKRMHLKVANSMTKRFRCPCCDNKTLMYKSPKYPELCPVCFWANESNSMPWQSQRFNKISLDIAKTNYMLFKAVSRGRISYARPPNEEMV